MYCPNCASQNNDDAKFCRTCGANLSLISQALTGEVSQVRHDKHGKSEHKSPPSFPNGVGTIIGGFGFILAAFGVLYWGPAGEIWWFWMFIPALGTIGKGVAECLSAKQLPPASTGPAQMTPPGVITNELPSPRIAPELSAPPSSVTESTTRLFDESNRKN
jgi:hypothetical protein